MMTFRPPDLAYFRLPATGMLEGHAIVMRTHAGERLDLAFASQSVAWRASLAGFEASGTDRYEATEVRPELFFVDIDLATPPLDSLTLVISRLTGWAVIVHQRRHLERNPAVEQRFMSAAIEDVPQVGPMPAPTDLLLGRWHMIRYSPANLYEHIYLSSTRMCAHNLNTENTRGRAECHDASYMLIEDDLVLIGWRETDSQAGMLLLEDIKALRVTGKVLHPFSDGESRNAPIGGLILPVEISFPAETASERRQVKERS